MNHLLLAQLINVYQITIVPGILNVIICRGATGRCRRREVRREKERRERREQKQEIREVEDEKE